MGHRGTGVYLARRRAGRAAGVRGARSARHERRVSTIRWTRLYRALEPYLKPIDEESGAPTAGRLDFYHDQLRSAVYRRYLHMAAEPDATVTDRYREEHRQLSAYFRVIAYDETLPDKWRNDRVHGLSELPFHQTLGEMWEELDATLCDSGSCPSWPRTDSPRRRGSYRPCSATGLSAWPLAFRIIYGHSLEIGTHGGDPFNHLPGDTGRRINLVERRLEGQIATFERALQS